MSFSENSSVGKNYTLQFRHDCTATESQKISRRTQKGIYSLALKCTTVMRPFGAVIGGLCAVVDTAFRVATVAEILIRGLCNIAGAAFSKGSFTKGLKQIFLGIPLTVLSLAFSPVSNGIEILADTLAMLVLPSAFLKFGMFRNDMALKSLKKMEDMASADESVEEVRNPCGCAEDEMPEGY